MLKKAIALALVLLLFFSLPCLRAEALPSLSRAIAPFQKLPGTVSVLVQKEGAALIELNSEEPLAVASAFKLLVLAVLKRDIDRGNHAWQEVVELQPQEKSLPSGVLQSWPDYSPLTLQTLATLMISISDNTAADILIRVVGRETLEKFSRRNSPFLTTREAFILKNPKNQNLLSKYRQSHITSRNLLFDEIEKAPLPEVKLVDSFPVATDIEWFFTARELCQLTEEVAELPLMQINSGVVDEKEWQRVAFKGGEEPGVLNLTTWLRADDGTDYCVAATWNHTETLDKYHFLNLYQQLVQKLQ